MLQHALDMGYKVLKIYEVWHWKEKKKGLSAHYINKFLKVKMEAAGLFSKCGTEVKKRDYI